MSSTVSDIIFKHQPPLPSDPGYRDWAERLFEMGYDNPYDAYVGLQKSNTEEKLAVASAAAVGVVAAASLVSEEHRNKVLGVGLAAVLVGLFVAFKD